MPKIVRIAAPGYPHHITQRGNRRQPTFFSNDDYEPILT
jgi:putative transposase